MKGVVKGGRVDRRTFLQLGAGALLGSGLAGVGVPAAARGRAQKHLVCVWLQGGVDGLSLLPPLRDRAYHELRGRTAVPADRVIALGAGTNVGLHPAFAPLAPWIARGEVRGVVGVGITGIEGRSHARAEARLVETLRNAGARAAGVPAWELASLSLQLRLASEQIAAADEPEAVLVTVPGFDTHAAQSRRLEQAFAQVARDLSVFLTELGERFADTVVLVVSEQGRGLRENRRAGTDDGVAGAALLLGGALPPVGVLEAVGTAVPHGWPELAALVAAGEDALPVSIELAELLGSLGREVSRG